MSELGVFAVDRGIFDDPDFANEPFTEREAFMWLVSEAAWRERVSRCQHGAIKLMRGDVCHSVRFMAKAWQWSKSRVDRFMKKLVSRGILMCENRDGEIVYSVKNYNRFQRVSLPERDRRGTVAGQERDKLEDIENIEDIYSEPKGSSYTSDALVLDLNLQAINTPEPKKVPASEKKNEDVTRAVEIYNKAAAEAGWPQAQKMSKARESSLKARLADVGGLDGWIAAMEKAKASAFLRGETDPDSTWKPGLDFFLKASKFTKLMEGGYDDRKPTRRPEPARVSTSEENILRAFAFAGQAATGNGHAYGSEFGFDDQPEPVREIGFGG